MDAASPPSSMHSSRRTSLLVAAALAVVLAVAASGSPSRGASAPGAVDVYPIGGTKMVNPDTTISFRGSTTIAGLTVTGSKSGRHSGHLVTHSDGKGVTFVPDSPFRENEGIAVKSTTRLTRADSTGTVRLHTYTRPDPKWVKHINDQTSDPGGDPAGDQHFASRRDLRPPGLKVTTKLPAASTDPLFYAVKAGPGQNGPIIRDADGRLIWFRSVPAELSPYDFRAQSYRGKPVLTWWEGRVLAGKGRGEGLMLDTHYRLIKHVRAGNGYDMDQHEFQLTPRGTAYINVYEAVKFSLKPAGGPKNGAAWDSIVQEIDIKTGLVLYEWHSLAHVSVSLGTFPIRDNGRPYDPFHVNSVDEDGAGNLLFSARNTNALFLVNRHTGSLLSRIGGKKSDYTMGPGAATIGQHQATIQPNGEITDFDNGGSTHYATMPDRESRGVRLRLDAPSRTVSLVRQYTHPGQALFSRSQGSMQVLRNDDVFLSWGGGNPYLTEQTPDGQTVFESYIDPKEDDTYRAYRMPWHGTPAAPPDAVASTSSTATDVYMSWNGATEVRRWRILAGDDPGHLPAVGTFDVTDFETHVRLPGAAPKYVQARALDANGKLIGKSAVIRPKRV
jgi:hypothetical protein